MEKLFDLPAHPLLVHAPVVLLPLTLILILAVAVRPSWRSKGTWAMAAASIITLVSTFMAKSSGDAFDSALNEQFTIDRSVHRDLGNQTLLLVFAMALLSVVAAVMDMRYRRSAAGVAAGEDGTVIKEPSSAMSHLAMLLTLLVAVAATYWMIRTGHEGAKLVHEGKI